MMADSPPPPPAEFVVDSAITAAGQFLLREIATPDGPRRFKLYVPSRFDKSRPAPLLVVLHGCTQNPDDIARGTRFNAVAEETGMLVVYPEQPQTANGLKCWNWFDAAHQRRDKGEPALIAEMTQRVITEYSVDARRVYVVGVSAGAAMALTVAYAFPEVFAAAGIHSGAAYGAATSVADALKVMGAGAADSVSLPGAVVKGMGGRRSLPAIVFHGGADKTVKVVNVWQVVSQLSELHASGGLKKLSETPGSTQGGYHFTKTVYGNARPLIEVWVVDELGHAWSGGSSEGTYTDPKGPDASREMIRFLLDHPRN